MSNKNSKLTLQWLHFSEISDCIEHLIPRSNYWIVLRRFPKNKWVDRIFALAFRKIKKNTATPESMHAKGYAYWYLR